MAFLSKVGKIIRQTSAHVTASNSMLQSIRCMSSSKIFVGGDNNNTLIRFCKRVLSFLLVSVCLTKLFYVALGISYSTDEFGLREAFSKYGEVVDGKLAN